MPADEATEVVAITMALAQAPHLRAMTGAPLTLRDLPVIGGLVASMLTGKAPPALPAPLAGDGQTTPTPDVHVPPGTAWWVLAGVEEPP